MKLSGNNLRSAIAKTAKLIAQKNINVTQRGHRAYVRYNEQNEPVQLNVPMVPDGADEKLLKAIQGYIDHECAHVFYTDMAHERVVGKRIAQENSLNDDFVFSVFNLIEDVRIEKLIGRRLRGSNANLESVRTHVAQEIQSHCEGLDMTDPQLARGRLMACYIRGRAGQQAFADVLAHFDADKFFEPIDRAIPDLGDRLRGLETPTEMTELAEDFIKAMLENTPPPPMEDQPPGQDQCDDGGPDENNPDDDQDGEGADGEGADGESSETEETEETEETSTGTGEDESSEDGTEANGDQGSSGECGQEDDDDKTEGENNDTGQGDGDQTGDTDDQGDQDGDQGDTGDQGDQDGDGDGNGDGDGDTDEGELSNEQTGSPNVGPGDWMPPDQTEFEDMDAALEALVMKYTVEALAEDAAPLIDFSNDLDTTYVPDPDQFRFQKDYSPSGIENSVKHAVSALQKELQRLIAAKSLSTRIGGFRSGRLHAPSLHRVLAGDDRVFTRKQEVKTKETAVSLLIDCSGSMERKACERDRKNKLTLAVESAWAFAETLQRIDVKHEITGFTTPTMEDVAPVASAVGQSVNSYLSQREKEACDYLGQTGVPRNKVRFSGSKTILLKGFHEKFAPSVKAKMASIVTKEFSNPQALGNFDAIAIRDSARRLMAQPQERKIMFVFSDGYPAAEMATDEQAALHYEIQKAEKMGVEIVAIGIASEAVSEFYKRSTVVYNVEQLPSVTIKKLREVLV